LQKSSELILAPRDESPSKRIVSGDTAIISVRLLPQTESTTTLLVYQDFIVGVLAGVPLFWFWVTPDLSDLEFLLALGVMAAAVQWVGVIALYLSEANVISNIQYVQLIHAAILGFILFDEIPDTYTLIGAPIIISSSLFLIYREALSKKKGPL
jgi:drug/metabolite transporter (DMT)-like permease